MFSQLSSGRRTVLFTWSGTHTGHLWGTEGQGAHLNVTSTVEVSVQAGKLSRIVETVDWTEARRQIGAGPTPAPFDGSLEG